MRGPLLTHPWPQVHPPWGSHLHPAGTSPAFPVSLRGTEGAPLSTSPPTLGPGSALGVSGGSLGSHQSKACLAPSFPTGPLTAHLQSERHQPWEASAHPCPSLRGG